MLHDDTVLLKFTGNAVLAGKVAVMVRADLHAGSTACQGAAGLAVANGQAVDHGGELVLQADGFYATTIRLPGVTDGRTETVATRPTPRPTP